MRLVAFALLVPSIAAAEPAFTPDKVIVVGRVGDGAWTDAATEARSDQNAQLAAVVIGKRAGKRIVLAPADVGPPGKATVTIGGTAYKTELLDGKVQWSTVEPHGFRANPAKSGVTSDFYSNVSIEPKNFGKWIGYDTIDYFEHATGLTTGVIAAKVVASEPGAQVIAGIGTIRYKVEVEIGGKTLASPGAEATDTLGMLPGVHRVTIRRGDDFLGRLSGYLLVPEVFGSAGGVGAAHQTDRFTGADCADVMVGAERRMGRQYTYTNVEGLEAYAKVIAKPVRLDDKGMPATEITGVKPGDLIRIDYGADSPRPGWDHVAALWEDKSDPAGPNKGGPDGKLDAFDLVIHMGHPRLKIEPLARQSPATIDVLRWR